MIGDIQMRILLTYVIYTSSTVALVVKIYIWRKSGLKLIEKQKRAELNVQHNMANNMKYKTYEKGSILMKADTRI